MNKIKNHDQGEKNSNLHFIVFQKLSSIHGANSTSRWRNVTKQCIDRLSNYVIVTSNDDSVVYKIEPRYFKAELLKLKLERAATLVDCLAGERQRWEQTVKVLDLKYTFLPGDCLLATAFVSYTGPFVSAYRDDLIVMWHKLVGCFIVLCQNN